jgi:hypothetical protein
MNRNLLKAIAIALLYGILLLPNKLSAQCSCSAGAPPHELKYTVVVNPLVSSSLNVSFPKFNPSLGNLNCVKLEDAISVSSSLGVRNTDTVDKSYRFRLSITTDITGPSLSVNDLQEVTYGPDLLGAYGSPTDSINYGPDTIYDKNAYSTYSSSVVPYLGTSGNVDFTYSLGGGVVSLAGGLNFSSSIRTVTWGTFTITYYWCDNVILASGIKDFTATKKHDVVNLQWLTTNDESSNNQYEIQVSYDGKSFKSIQQAVGNTDAAHASSAKHEYQYTPDQPFDRKLYFRIKQVNGNTVKYSVVRTVDPPSTTGNGIRIFPNPVAQRINMQFDEAINGNVVVEVANQLGQSVYRGNIRLNNSNVAQIILRDTPRAGVYFLRAYATADADRVYSTKLLVSDQ